MGHWAGSKATRDFQPAAPRQARDRRATGSWQEKDILNAEPLLDLASWLLPADKSGLMAEANVGGQNFQYIPK